MSSWAASAISRSAGRGRWAGPPGRYQLRIGGRLAWLLWLGVHIVYLIGFRNRLQVLIDWAWKYFTSRGAGAILLEQAQDLTPDITVTDRMPFSADGGSRNRRPAI